MALDDNDIRILQELQENGRLSFRQIAEKVNISVPTVSSKVNNLERVGAIRGYRVDLDTERLGELSTIVLIRARPSNLSTISDKLANDDEVRQIFLLSSGRLMLICTFSNAYSINDFAIRLNGLPEIMEYDIANIINVVKEEERASVIPGIRLTIPCRQCGRHMKDHPYQIRERSHEIYLCSPTCKDIYASGSINK
ncbi:MAG: winged helix-turn-helix transcriptional regulator [Euryarchaeota archaeon]|nr:winged helix-turn-helix transcriptional regulator [Euryarchaeota archaeon]